MQKTYFKLVFFILIMGVFIMTLKSYKLPLKPVEEVVWPGDQNSKYDTTLYFVGSSRVQRSLNPALLGDYLKKYDVLNMGISGSTFLGNSIVADYILQGPSHKVVFIELSPMKYSLPDGVFKFAETENFSAFYRLLELTSTFSFSERVVAFCDILNVKIFSKLNLKSDIKRIIGYKQRIEENPHWIGFRPSTERNINQQARFLELSDYNEKSCKNTYQKYEEIIESLDHLAQKNQSRIVFFLPLTYLKQAEVEIVTSIFACLPERMKLVYSNSFIESCSDITYLADKNHFNAKGAEVYSNFLVDELDIFFKK